MNPEDFSFADLREAALTRESLGRLLSLIQVELGIKELECWYQGFVDICYEFNVEYLNLEELLCDFEFEIFEHFKLVELFSMEDNEIEQTREELRV